MTNLVLGILLGLLVGAVLCWLSWQRSRTQIAEAHATAAGAQAEAAEATARLAAEQARAQAAIERADRIAADRDQMADQFSLLSHESLERQGKRVHEALLSPVQEALSKLHAQLEQTERERAAMSATFASQLHGMTTAHDALRRETSGLVNALRKPHVRGAWGETQLRRIAEMSGAIEHCDFMDQWAATRADGSRQRPDMRVDLGEGRVLFVDSKVPLAAFMESLDARDDAGRRQAEALFAKHVKKHVDALGGKSYWELADGAAPAHVILFLPGEGFLLAALEHEPGLYQYAIERGVLLATPNTLIALLHTVAHTWRQTELTRDAQRVLDLSSQLYERLGTMGEHVDRLGKSLTQGVRAYNHFVGSVDARLMPTARDLHDLQIGREPLAPLSLIDEVPRDSRTWGALDSDPSIA